MNAQNPAVGIQHNAIQTDEQCVPGDWIVGQIYARERDYIWKIQEVQQITFASSSDGTTRVESVSVIMDDGSKGQFRPMTLLLCAGERNQNLLATKSSFPAAVSPPPDFATLNQLQRSTKMDMLVARDRTGTLPEFNGSISGGIYRDSNGLAWNVDPFVVSRRDLNRDLVWIFSGRLRRTDSSGQRHWMTPNQNRAGLINWLSQVFPQFGQLHKKMIWGIYSAALTTLSRQPGQDFLAARTITNMGVEGLLVCYTDRLTIAPLAADAIEQEISSNLKPSWPTSSVPMPKVPPGPVAIHPEYWRTPGRWVQQTSWTWDEFKKNCL
jgi:hypothetical protein